jgi:hypothetical protein
VGFSTSFLEMSGSDILLAGVRGQLRNGTVTIQKIPMTLATLKLRVLLNFQHLVQIKMTPRSPRGRKSWGEAQELEPK